MCEELDPGRRPSSIISYLPHSSSKTLVIKRVWSPKIEHIEGFMVLCLNRAMKVLGWIKVSKGGNMLDLPVLDHLIVSSEGYYSFIDEGLF